MIKAVRAVTFLGLKEAKDIVDRAEQVPTELRSNLSQGAAKSVQDIIVQAGGIVEITDFQG